MLNFLSNLVAPLNHVVFVMGSDHVSWSELLGFVTGAACVWLTLKARISNFPVGIANSAFFLILFATARLWADSSLQVVYIILGFIGWWQWLRGGPSRTRLQVRRAPRWSIAAGIAFVATGSWGLAVILTAAHDIAPLWDAVTTCLSLVAQVLLNWKRLQNWWFWIAADLIYIPLYVVKRLDLTAIVYVLFLAMCIGGLRAWRSHDRSPAETAPPIGLAVKEPA